MKYTPAPLPITSTAPVMRMIFRYFWRETLATTHHSCARDSSVPTWTRSRSLSRGLAALRRRGLVGQSHLEIELEGLLRQHALGSFELSFRIGDLDELREELGIVREVLVKVGELLQVVGARVALEVQPAIGLGVHVDLDPVE